MPNDYESSGPIFGGQVYRDPRAPRSGARRNRGSQQNQDPTAVENVGILVTPDARHDLDRMILPNETKSTIVDAIRFVQNRAEIDRLFHLDAVEPMRGRCLLNFYGPPGTGKTMAAKAVARHMRKDLYQVDYASIISCFVGNTAKGIRTAFEEAKELDAVLFFDEADSLLSKRTTDMSMGAGVNQNRNVLMQELDNHDGIVIMTTNLFSNFDEAVLRRVAEHVKFDLPSVAERAHLFALHMPYADRCKNVDIVGLAEASEGLSGGDIFNVSLNAVRAACSGTDANRWFVTQDILLTQIGRVKEAKREHAAGETERRRCRPGMSIRGGA